MKLLIVGCGFFSQNTHIPLAVKCLGNKNIFLYDERLQLKKKTSKYFNCHYLDKINKKNLQDNKITGSILCFERDKSYNYIKKLLNLDLHVLAEKPICSSSKKIKTLFKLAKRKKLLLKSCFQRQFSKEVAKFKYIIKKNKYKKLKFYCEFYSGNFRFNKKTKVRTSELINNIKNYTNHHKISFLVFLNRYWHIINFLNFLFEIKKNFKNIQFLKIDKKNITDYKFEFRDKKNEYILKMNSNFKSGWYEKYYLYDQNKRLFHLKVNAPLHFNSHKIESTIYKNQFYSYLDDIKKLNYSNILNCINELLFIEKIWEKKISR